MTFLLPIVLLLAGLVILYFGAEVLVDGASAIARAFGISPLIIGLTIVGFATSAPEFVVSLLSAVFRDSPDVALGNVVGSNIANIVLIIGASALIAPLAIERGLLRRDLPMMIGIEALAVVFCATGAILARSEAAALVAVLVLFLFLALRDARRQSRETREARETGTLAAVASDDLRHGRNTLKVLGGLVGLVIGADLMVRGAVDIATQFGISQLVIGVTIVALGTSLPELATSLVAAFKGESDISIGNIVGSNLFNTGFILGGVGLIQPIPVHPQANAFDLPYMLLTALLLLPILLIGKQIGRIKAALLLFAYAAYITITWMLSVDRLALPALPWL